MNSNVHLSPRDAHILRALISIQGAVPHADGNLRRALAEVLSQVPSATILAAGESPAPPTTVGLNDIVTVRPLSDPEPEDSTFQVVLPPLSNAAEGKISVFAPMSIGVLGHKCGDTVIVKTPEGHTRIEIVNIKKAA